MCHCACALWWFVMADMTGAPMKNSVTDASEYLKRCCPIWDMWIAYGYNDVNLFVQQARRQSLFVIEH